MRSDDIFQFQDVKIVSLISYTFQLISDGVPDFLHSLASMAAICNNEFTPSAILICV